MEDVLEALHGDRMSANSDIVDVLTNVWMQRLMSIIFSQQAMKEPRNIMRL